MFVQTCSVPSLKVLTAVSGSFIQYLTSIIEQADPLLRQLLFPGSSLMVDLKIVSSGHAVLQTGHILGPASWNENRCREIFEGEPYDESQGCYFIRNAYALSTGRQYILRLNPKIFSQFATTQLYDYWLLTILTGFGDNAINVETPYRYRCDLTSWIIRLMLSTGEGVLQHSRYKIVPCHIVNQTSDSWLVMRALIRRCAVPVRRPVWPFTLRSFAHGLLDLILWSKGGRHVFRAPYAHIFMCKFITCIERIGA